MDSKPLAKSSAAWTVRPLSQKFRRFDEAENFPARSNQNSIRHHPAHEPAVNATHPYEGRAQKSG